MKIEIIAPERKFFEGEASFIEFNTTEGTVGIYERHIPMTVVLAPGVMKIQTEEGEKIAALHSGFAEILGDRITILAESVEWPEEIDMNRANEAKIRAERRINDDATDMNRAELALKKSLVRLSLGKK